MNKRFLYAKPANSERLGRVLVVRQPERDGAPLPAAGAKVPPNAYWLRRLREGSVTEATPPREAKRRAERKDTAADTGE